MYKNNWSQVVLAINMKTHFKMLHGLTVGRVAQSV